MGKILPLLPDEVPIIQTLARATWPTAFAGILTGEQITYMLEMIYSLPALQMQIRQKGHRFMLYREEEIVLGFISYELNVKPSKTKVHKLYVLPEAQGKGIGKQLLQKVESLAIEASQTDLFLNVNRFNHSAINFYNQIGFREIGKEVIDIGNGYVMDDLIMEKKLVP
jgi:diamine N-acetyltransferase